MHRLSNTSWRFDIYQHFLMQFVWLIEQMFQVEGKEKTSQCRPHSLMYRWFEVIIRKKYQVNHQELSQRWHSLIALTVLQLLFMTFHPFQLLNNGYPIKQTHPFRLSLQFLRSLRISSPPKQVQAVEPAERGDFLLFQPSDCLSCGFLLS